MQVIFDRKKLSAIHLIWGPIAIMAVVAAAMVNHFLAELPNCPFKIMTGYPCLTCGGTRCLAELAHFSVWESFLYNPLVFLTVLGLLFFSTTVLVGLIFKFGIKLVLSDMEKKLIRYGIIALAAADWIYLIAALK